MKNEVDAISPSMYNTTQYILLTLSWTITAFFPTTFLWESKHVLDEIIINDKNTSHQRDIITMRWCSLCWWSRVFPGNCLQSSVSTSELSSTDTASPSRLWLSLTLTRKWGENMKLRGIYQLSYHIIYNTTQEQCHSLLSTQNTRLWRRALLVW